MGWFEYLHCSEKVKARGVLSLAILTGSRETASGVALRAESFGAVETAPYEALVRQARGRVFLAILTGSKEAAKGKRFAADGFDAAKKPRSTEYGVDGAANL